MSEYIKGDYTRCYEDICEIWYEDNLYCIVRTDDADKLIDVLNENEQLKHDATVLIQATQDYRKENEQLKQLIKKVLENTPIEHSLAIDLKNSIRELYE